ncbi:MAG: reverse transcriptase family protein, partial [Thermoplasmata archaeon]
ICEARAAAEILNAAGEHSILLEKLSQWEMHPSSIPRYLEIIESIDSNVLYRVLKKVKKSDKTSKDAVISKSIIKLVKKSLRVRRLLYKKGVIGTLGRIVNLIDIGIKKLRILFYLTRNKKQLYSTFTIPKKDGSPRSISAPEDFLKYTLRKVLSGILEKEPLHPCCIGFRKGYSTFHNAFPHAGKEMVINIDIEDFFPTITTKRVYGLFYSMGFTPPEAHFLSSITTFEGKLPQGAPTSPAIANLVCRRLDRRLAGLASKAGASYTRYADDITFSGSSEIRRIIPLAERIIKEEGFNINKKKIRILRKGRRQEVTGLTVNNGVHVPRKLRRIVRAMIHRLNSGEVPHYKGKDMSPEQVIGYVSYMQGIEKQRAILQQK